MVTAMEPPVSFAADEVRDEKVKVLRALMPIAATTSPTTRARAVRPWQLRRQRGRRLSAGAEREPDVERRDVRGDAPRDRQLALCRRADLRPRGQAADEEGHRDQRSLQGRAARCPVRATSPHGAGRARRSRGCGSAVDPDVLAIRIQPDEGIGLRFVAKVPGPTMTLRPVTMDFRYGSAFGGSGPEAYERLILDAMLGDPTLFARVDEVQAAWRFITPILEAWSNAPPPQFPNYAAGTWGPPSATELIERDGRAWRRL